MRNSNEIPLFNAKQNLLFQSTAIELNNLDQDLKNSES